MAVRDDRSPKVASVADINRRNARMYKAIPLLRRRTDGTVDDAMFPKFRDPLFTRDAAELEYYVQGWSSDGRTSQGDVFVRAGSEKEAREKARQKLPHAVTLHVGKGRPVQE